MRRLNGAVFGPVAAMLIGLAAALPAPAGDEPSARSDALELYKARLLQVGRKVGSYPGEAVARRQEGTAQIMVTVAADGTLRQHKLVQSSGHETLDAQALVMVEKAVPLAEIPMALKNSQFDVLVIFVFALPKANRA